MHLILILACLSLLGVIAFQDWRVPALRNESISAGLTGPWHVLLDASYVPMALFLPLATFGHTGMFLLALVASFFLIAVAVTNTAHTYIDSITGGKHALWHSRCTAVVFAASLLLEVAGNGHSPGFWGLTAVNVMVPAAIYGLTYRSDYAEKLGVGILCFWLIFWAL